MKLQPEVPIVSKNEKKVGREKHVFQPTSEFKQSAFVLYYHFQKGFITIIPLLTPLSFKPPFPPRYYSSLINDGLCSSTTTVKPLVD